MDRDFERKFPNLVPFLYRETSPCDGNYNCVSWALKEKVDERRVWWPVTIGQAQWPESLPFSEKIENFVKLFRSFGYETCADDKVEQGFEKIALYADEDGNFSHVARQLESGKWTSKLAAEEDIEHDNLYVLTGPCLGRVWGFMSRPSE